MTGLTNSWYGYGYRPGYYRPYYPGYYPRSGVSIFVPF